MADDTATADDGADRRAANLNQLIQAAYWLFAGVMLWVELRRLHGESTSLGGRRCAAGEQHWLRWDLGRHCPCRLEEGKWSERVAADEAELGARIRYLGLRRRS